MKIWADQLGESRKALARWLKLGLDHVQHSLVRVRVQNRGDQLPIVEVVQRASGREDWNDFLYTARYALLGNGELHVENVVALGKDMLDIPRVGVELSLVPGLEQLEYFGRGPLENYSDRKISAMVGRYQNTVDGEYVPYIMPQEHGHHTDVRWLTLTNEQGHGLEVTGDDLFEFNVSHFTTSDLYAGRHTTDLHPCPEVILSLDAAQRGLGTASCGPDTLPQYQLREKKYQFTYRLKVL
jgi:beta-galactosidase